jgi:hypothetical protein
MDLQGQRLSELIFYWIIISFGAVGWVIGYFQQDFLIVFQVWLVGVVLSVLVRALQRLSSFHYDNSLSFSLYPLVMCT